MNEAAISPHICQTPEPEHIHQNPTEPLLQGLGDGELIGGSDIQFYSLYIFH